MEQQQQLADFFSSELLELCTSDPFYDLDIDQLFSEREDPTPECFDPAQYMENSSTTVNTTSQHATATSPTPSTSGRFAKTSEEAIKKISENSVPKKTV